MPKRLSFQLYTARDHGPLSATIEEDVHPLHLLVSDYDTWLK